MGGVEIRVDAVGRLRHIPAFTAIYEGTMGTVRSLRIGILGSLIAAGMSAAGCSSMNNTEKGAGIGGALGAGLGLAAGAATGNPRTGR